MKWYLHAFIPDVCHFVYQWQCNLFVGSDNELVFHAKLLLKKRKKEKKYIKILKKWKPNETKLWRHNASTTVVVMMMPRLFVCALFFVLFPIDCCVFIKNRKKLLAIAMFHVNAHNFVSSKLKCYWSSFGNAWLSDLLVPSVRICYKCVFQVVCSFRWWVLLSAFQLYHFACSFILCDSQQTFAELTVCCRF